MDAADRERRVRELHDRLVEIQVEVEAISVELNEMRNRGQVGAQAGADDLTYRERPN